VHLSRRRRLFELYLVLGVGGASGRDIYRAALASGTWDVEPVAQANSAYDDTDPVVSPDELVLYFRRAQTGVMMATRAKTTDPFGVALPVPGLAGIWDDRPMWVSSDHCALLLTSDREGDGVRRAYTTRRAP
jgi:hypothetical protein